MQKLSAKAVEKSALFTGYCDDNEVILRGQVCRAIFLLKKDFFVFRSGNRVTAKNRSRVRISPSPP